MPALPPAAQQCTLPATKYFPKGIINLRRGKGEKWLYLCVHLGVTGSQKAGYTFRNYINILLQAKAMPCNSCMCLQATPGPQRNTPCPVPHPLPHFGCPRPGLLPAWPGLPISEIFIRHDQTRFSFPTPIQEPMGQDWAHPA